MQNMNWKIVGLTIAAIALVAGGYLAGMKWVGFIEHDPAYEQELASEAVQRSNIQLAVDLYSKLAKQGNAAAAYRLGDMYQYGLGVDVDANKAVKWLTQAANTGNVDASRQLGIFYLDGDIAVQDFAKARKWLHKAADAGDVTALRSLGNMNEHGLGKQTDAVKAYAYYAAAVVRNNGNGSAMRDKLERTLTTDQQIEGQKEARQILARIHTTNTPTKSAMTTDKQRHDERRATSSGKTLGKL